MDTGERLAAYLAGELDTDESRALEAELARAPALRAQLARLRRLEDALESLPAPTPPEGLRGRLHAAVQDELDRQPLPDSESERGHGVPDQLAARRQRSRSRGLPDWLPAVAGAAAVLVLVVGAVTLLPSVGGSDDSAEDAAGGATEEALDSGDAAAMSAPEASTADGPVIRAEGTAYDAVGLDALALDARFADIVERSLTGEQAEATAQRYRSPLAVDQPVPAPDDADEGTAADSAESDGARAADDPAPLQIIGPVAEEDLADIRRCLEGILTGDETLIPMYAELATFEQEPVIVYGILSRDPGPGTYTRVELWAVDRADCQVRYFTQADRAAG